MELRCFFFALAMSVILITPAQAQEETRHEIAVTYGAVPSSLWFDVFANVIPSIFGEKHDNTQYIGPIGMEYFYHTSPLVGVGAVAVFSTNNEDTYRNETLSKHKLRSYYTLMPAVKFNWLRKNNWGMYSKLALGASLGHFSSQGYNENGKLTGEKTTSNEVFFNFQASVIGIEAGNSHVRGFVELGPGEQGVALVGIRCKF